MDLNFHPAVASWFTGQFSAPTATQRAAWAAIAAGRHTLVAAPTGSGKTLAAFLQAIDGLVQAGLRGELADRTTVLYVSPLKALSNDIQRNLQQPLQGIAEVLQGMGLPAPAIRALVRTGDTPQAERAAMVRRPPQILVTTPESLYILLGSISGRRLLAGVRSVIIDEIHALIQDKRGAHLALSLERLASLAGPLQRIGLSATQSPIEAVARFLVGGSAVDGDGNADVAIIDAGHVRQRDLALELGPLPLAPVMSMVGWEQIHDRLATMARAHRTTLVFANTRRQVERTARALSERLGREQVAAHHGSMARELRLDAEQRLKDGKLRLLVATASLEMGIDIGEVDLVCQLGSPHSISAFLQRVGRSGHALGATPKGRLFPLSRDDLVECAALLDAVQRGELDQLQPAGPALDVLAQQVVAEVAMQEWPQDALYECLRQAGPYADLSRADFDAVVAMLVDGYSRRRGPGAALLHRDGVNGLLRARRGARLTAVSSGGAIPDNADYQVVLEPAALVIGSVHEDFAVESLSGDVFQLGNASYRILRVEQGKVRVEDAAGLPPNVPFWLGEAPGRSDMLSMAVSRLREQAQVQLAEGGESTLREWLQAERQLAADAAEQLADYLARSWQALGRLPTQQALVMERFFDESGGTQLLIHSPWGSRLNRAWGLALRKRFCRRFNFELQAAATEDAIVLSLSTSHSFPLAEVAQYLHSRSVEAVLTQALLDAPMFGVRWRWSATTALALPRMRGGRKVAPQLQRMRAEDLVAQVFPDQIACAENLAGERQIPDHPLVRQTLHDCLHEAMDLAGLQALLEALEGGQAQVHCLELTAPSPLAAEILNARPWAFLDDAPLEERRTQAVQSRRWQAEDLAEGLQRLDPAAVAAVTAEAWPLVRDADELHAALRDLGALAQSELDGAASAWRAGLEGLLACGRATRLNPTPGSAPLWIASERLAQWRQLHPQALLSPELPLPVGADAPAEEAVDTLLELLRGRLAASGPLTAGELAELFQLPQVDIELALLRLQGEGYVMQGRFRDGAGSEPQWCERHLLARIHRRTLNQLRREIEPVEPRDYLRFLCQWQRLGAEAGRGPDALAAVLAQLEGFEAPAACWESDLLTARVVDYEPAWLDELCLAGRVGWTRLRGAPVGGGRSGPLPGTPIVLLQRRHLSLWNGLREAVADERAPSSRAQRVLTQLQQHGALFFDELVDAARLLEAEVESALGELVAGGWVHGDSFAGLRNLLLPAARRDRARRLLRRGRGQPWFGLQAAGRWAALRRDRGDEAASATDGAGRLAEQRERVEQLLRILLRRYGVICWQLLQREADWLPPWRAFLRTCQQLEARGEVRGGRFIAGLTGEQFALPEAISSLRAVRRQAPDGQMLRLATADPLNLIGSVLPGERLPALPGHRLVLRDGVPIAVLQGEQVRPLAPLDSTELGQARELLLGRAVPGRTRVPLRS